MVSRRARKMGERTGLIGMLDSLRFHEASRQGIGLLLLPVCAWFALPGSPERVLAGLALALIGEIWRIYAAGVIYKNKQLATTGAYSLVRHPLYLGNFMILAGFTFSSAHWGVIAAVIAFLVFYYPAAIRYEDAKLERLFGDSWREWSRSTPAMFPTRLRWRANTDAEWNARQSLLRNGELPISIYLVASAVLMLYRSGLI
ncbi:methyltransferase family protein [Elongatibacter sediminis]|uniref:Isoprenylcysteine carboxylmethyltransferase family protein n=1 Tax=Elongatibacter sediminis TaxID=3119006 RepID=A0AAW9RE42_9GAMM